MLVELSDVELSDAELSDVDAGASEITQARPDPQHATTIEPRTRRCWLDICMAGAGPRQPGAGAAERNASSSIS